MTRFDDFSRIRPLILASLTLMSSLNFMLSWVEHEKGLIISGPGHFQMDTISMSHIRLWVQNF